MAEILGRNFNLFKFENLRFENLIGTCYNIASEKKSVEEAIA